MTTPGDGRAKASARKAPAKKAPAKVAPAATRGNPLRWLASIAQGRAPRRGWSPPTVAFAGIWIAAWFVLSIWFVVGAWPTAERLETTAAATVTQIVVPPSATPTPTPSTSTPSVSTPVPAPTSAPAPTVVVPSGAVISTAGTAPAAVLPTASPSPSAAPAAAPAQDQIPALWGHVDGSYDTAILLISMAFGVIGACAHGGYILGGATRARDFAPTRLGWFLPQPPLGAALALLVYVTYRAGLISGQSGTATVSLFGAAAISGVAGLSTSAAFQRLTGGSSSGAGTAAKLPLVSGATPSSISLAHIPATLKVAGTNLARVGFEIEGANAVIAQASMTTVTLKLDAAVVTKVGAGKMIKVATKPESGDPSYVMVDITA